MKGVLINCQKQTYVSKSGGKLCRKTKECAVKAFHAMGIGQPADVGDKKRNYTCPYYFACLYYAALLDWDQFSCSSCKKYKEGDDSYGEQDDYRNPAIYRAL